MSKLVRSWNIDLAKACAMVLVVMQHAWSMLGLDEPSWGIVCSAYRAISTVGVPLFIFVSGALLLPRTPEPLSLFYKKRLKRLIIPFLLFAGLAYIASLLMGQYDWWNGDTKTAILRFLPMLLENKINILHWFVHMLVMLYLLTPFIQRALRSFTQREVEGILCIWAVGILLRQYYPALNIVSYTTALWKYLGIYIAGYYITQYRVGSKRYLYIGIVAALLLILVGTITDYALQLTVPLTAISIGLICLNLPTSRPIAQSTMGAVATMISRYSYTIYLTHVLLLKAFYMFIGAYISDIWIIWIPLIITPLVVSILCLACTAYDKIKWLPNNVVGIG